MGVHGGYWDVLGGGLPNTFVHDLVVHPRDGVLLAATHGRGVWQVNVGTLQEPVEDSPGAEGEDSQED